jgi:hypothetical protein
MTLNNAISEFLTDFSELQNFRRVTDAQPILIALEQLRESLDNRLQDIDNKLDGLNPNQS